MTAATAELCAHCQLPLGRHPMTGRMHGESRAFCCYGCSIAFQVTRGVHEESEAAWFLIRLGVGAFLAMNIMLFSLLLYSGTLTPDDAAIRQMVHFALLGLATPALAILGLPFLREALRAARAGVATVDTLITLGAGAAYGYSAWATLTGGTHVYFDTATMILVLFTLGRYLEASGRARAMRRLEPLLAPERQLARVVDDDGEHLRPSSEVAPGARVRVLPGERIPVDARVVGGESAVDESLLTGEPGSRPKAPGDPVHAGTTNAGGMLLLETLAAGTATRWAALARDVARSLRSKSPIQRIADRVAEYFALFVLALAVAVLVYWSQNGPFDQALLTGLAVLVVACPCALGLASPLATSLGLGLALRHGSLVRSGAALESLAGVRAVMLDKTGTLTAGHAKLVHWESLGDTPRAEILQRATALERGSEHVLARAVVAAADAAGVDYPAAERVNAVPGLGVDGVTAGEDVALGSPAYLERLGCAVPDRAGDRAAALARDGHTVSLIAWGGRVRGILAFSDPLREEAAEAVAALRRRGLHVVLASGDGESTVRTVAQEIAVDDWHAGCSPEDKRAVLAEVRRTHGRVAAVGDGLNDAPVLAAADVGIAVGGAADLAREAADVILPAGGLQSLPAVFALARQVRRTVIANLGWAFGYNLLALALAAAGLLQPILAALLMAGSSILVVFNSLRLEHRVNTFPTPPPAAEKLTEDTDGADWLAR